MGGADGEGEQQQQCRRHRRLRRFPSFEGLGRRAFACVRHLLLDANHLPSIPDGTPNTATQPRQGLCVLFRLNLHPIMPNNSIKYFNAIGRDNNNSRR
jgi:hypothetical protein